MTLFEKLIPRARGRGSLPLLSLPLLLALSGQGPVRGQQNGGDGHVDVSLGYYSPHNQSVWTITTLRPQSTNIVSVKESPPDVRFYVVQAHAYLHNITMSYNQTLVPHQHVNGTNLGLVWQTKQGPSSFYVINPNSENVTVMYAVVAYGAYSPIPGGCNMEFEIETAPYLKVRYNEAMVEVKAQPGQYPGASCTRDIVTHDVYRMYMPARDFTEETYFSAIQAMLTYEDILTNGTLAPLPISGSLMRRLYSLYAGTGSVYAVVAQSLQGTSAYVPAVSYGCSAIYFTDSCTVLTTTFSKVLVACLLFMGFFTCFYGHFFFRVQMFLAGFLSGGLLAYVGLIRLATLPTGSGMVLSLSCLVGLGVGAAFVLLWYLCGIPVMAILLLVTPLAFLFASASFYVGLGDLQFCQLDLDFWLAFLVLMLTLVLLVAPLLHHGSILSSAVVGAYAAVLPFDHYVGGNLKYIVINSLRRASVPGFSQAIISPPFQAADLWLSLLWLTLALSGLRVQQVRQRGRPPFPPASRRPPPAGLPQPPTARTPLRVSSRIPHGYGSVGDDDVFETPPQQQQQPLTVASAAGAVADWFGRGCGLRGR